jgi:hypothetical protein
MNLQGPMETLQQAISRLEKLGFVNDFRAARGGELRVGRSESRWAPEALVLDETVRFEGESDPGDSSILFALRSHDGRVQGTFVSSYGPEVDRDNAAVIERLMKSPNLNSKSDD